MKLIDKVTAHFDAKETRSIEISEWDVTIYANPLTLAEKHQWLGRAQGDDCDFTLYAVIYGARDENGELVFSIDDKIALKTQADPDIVSRVGAFVLEADLPDSEELEKNLQTTAADQTSAT